MNSAELLEDALLTGLHRELVPLAALLVELLDEGQLVLLVLLIRDNDVGGRELLIGLGGRRRAPLVLERLLKSIRRPVDEHHRGPLLPRREVVGRRAHGRA